MTRRSICASALLAITLAACSASGPLDADLAPVAERLLGPAEAYHLTTEQAEPGYVERLSATATGVQWGDIEADTLRADVQGLRYSLATKEPILVQQLTVRVWIRADALSERLASLAGMRLTQLAGTDPVAVEASSTASFQAESDAARGPSLPIAMRGVLALRAGHVAIDSVDVRLGRVTHDGLSEQIQSRLLAFIEPPAGRVELEIVEVHAADGGLWLTARLAPPAPDANMAFRQ